MYSTAPAFGAALANTCQKCVAGIYFTGVGLAAAASWTNCGAGLYSTAFCAALANTCQSCASGTYFTGVCLAAAASCTNCASGQYSTALGAIASSTCQNCVMGTYFDGTGASFSPSCIQCASGKYSSAPGAYTVQLPRWHVFVACGSLGCCLSPAYTARRAAVRIALLARISPTAPASSVPLAHTRPSETTRRLAKTAQNLHGAPLTLGARPAQCARSRSLQPWSASLQILCSTPFLASPWCFSCLLYLRGPCIMTGTCTFAYLQAHGGSFSMVFT